MLEALNVAIGFTTVMLAVSLVIMALTQAISSVLALRGVQLRRGLQQLIEETVPELNDRAAQVSQAIVRHPLISDGATRLAGPWRNASAIRREELLPVLNAVLGDLNLSPIPDGSEQAARLTQWFDSFMARVSQWFVMNTRWITIALACVVTFALHLDSVGVLRQVMTDAETRARLVAMSGSLLDHSPSAVEAVEAVYTAEVKALVRAHADTFAVGEAAVPTFESQAEAKAWISTHLADPAVRPAAPDLQALSATFDRAVSAALTESLDRSIDRVKTLRTELSSTGLQLVADGHTRDHWYTPNEHLGGMFVSVLLLSLGAPFWFNVLKHLTSLKTAITRAAEPPPAAGSAGPAVRAFRARGADDAPDSLPALPAGGRDG